MLAQSRLFSQILECQIKRKNGGIQQNVVWGEKTKTAGTSDTCCQSSGASEGPMEALKGDADTEKGIQSSSGTTFENEKRKTSLMGRCF